MELKGVDIVETWQNPQSGEYFALAALSRNKAAREFSRRISDLDQETARHLQRARQSRDPLDQIAYLQRAVDNQGERAQVLDFLQAISPAKARSLQPHKQLDNLQAQAQTQRRRLPISVEVAGDLAHEMGEYVRGGLAAAGYTADEAGATRFTLSAALALDAPVNRRGINWITGAMDLKLVDNQTGKVRGACTWDIKEGARNLSVARQDVRRFVEQQLSREFDRVMRQFVNSAHCNGR